MKKWIVRFASLLVFNVALLLIIGWLTPARVGWAALWAGIVMTALVIWIKPLIEKWFRSMAAKSAHQRTKIGEKLVEVFLVLAVAFIVWVLTLTFSGASAGGWFWAYVIPPILLTIGWSIYALIDDRIEEHAGSLYDRATGSVASGAATPAASPPPPAARAEASDGLTEEQRRMLDELGKG